MNRTHFCLWLALASSIVPVAAQSKVASDLTRADIQATANALNAAMLRGDAERVNQFLAPSFEWTTHDLNWMRRTLPSRLERAKFDSLTVKIWIVDIKDGRATARGYVRARASLGDGTQKTGLDDDYEATWIGVEGNWYLQRDDKMFDLLQRVAQADAKPPVEPVAPPQKTVVLMEPPSQWQRNPIAFSPDGSAVAAYSVLDGLRLYSARTGALLQSITVPMAVNSLAYAPDGTLVTGHGDGRVRLWDAQGHLKCELAASKVGIYSLSVSPDGNTLAADSGGNVVLFDMATWRLQKTLMRHSGDVRTLAFSPDGKVLAITAGRAIELWNLQDAKLVQTLSGDSWGGFEPDGSIAVVNFGNVRFRRLGSDVVREAFMPRLITKPRSEMPAIGNIPFVSGFFRLPRTLLTPDGQSAVSVYLNGTLRVWDIETGQLKTTLSGFSRNGGDDVDTITFSPDSMILAATSRTGEIALWNMPTPSNGMAIVPSVTVPQETGVKPGE